MSDPKPMTIDPVVLANDAGDETLYFAGLDRQGGTLWTSVVSAAYVLLESRAMERRRERLPDDHLDNLRLLRVETEQTSTGLRAVRLLDDQDQDATAGRE
jgi:hypothetical protein